MKKYIIKGRNPLRGEIQLSGSKNAVLKALVAACLTEDEVEIKNVPLISDVFAMTELIRKIGGKATIRDHTIKVRVNQVKSEKIPLEIGAKVRTSSMFLAPLLARRKKAVVPNPGGCRIGARPIDRHIEGFKKMGTRIYYTSQDGYFHATTEGLKGAKYTFPKNTHTGTETLILAAVLAEGKTALKNAALEPEIDDLISLLNKMGAKIQRTGYRAIEIEGVKKLHGAVHSIMSDSNELVTFAILSSLTGGNITIKNGNLSHISSFLNFFRTTGGDWEQKDSSVRFFIKSSIFPKNITTSPYPGFMTDWQGPSAVYLSQAEGISSIHEAIYEDRFGYVEQLTKMGVKIKYFQPPVNNPDQFYNFNYQDTDGKQNHAIRIYGKADLHSAILDISDLRAGATLVIAALIAKGNSIVYGIEHLERGYEKVSERLSQLGADIKLEEE